jgi:hypothetical protein
MKSKRLFRNYPVRWAWASLLGIWVPASALLGAETNAPPATTTNTLPATATNAPATTGTNAAPKAAAQAVPDTFPTGLSPDQIFEGGTNTYNNWVDLAAGGFIVNGNRAQFQQTHHAPSSGFGGIEDLHYQADLAKGTTLAIDGHALFDNDDYKLSLALTKEKLGYLKFSYNEFRTYYNGDGGFFPPTGSFYSSPNNPLELDRGDISFEAGLTLENVPKITFKYEHTFREGEKDSTEWGYTHPVGGTLVRGLSPSFYNIDEHSDIFQLDATHHIKATDLALGIRYETGTLNDALNITQFPGEAFQQKITDRQETTYDLFNVHASSETWLKKNLLLSAGFSYSDLDNNFSGSRIYGSDFDVGYVPSIQNGFGFYNLLGSSSEQEYVMDLNLMAKPNEHLSIVPSVRVQKEDLNASSGGLETLGDNTPAPFSSVSEQGILDVRERLDVTYNGFTNWVLYARGDLTEGTGNLNENGGLIPINGIGIPSILRQTDENRLFQKYSAGVRWYPTRQIILDVGGYYKNNNYDYSHDVDSTPNNSDNRYPAYLVMQDFETYDGNLRLTLRPRQNLTMVTRYEYQLSTIQTAPDPISGLFSVESSKMTSHIIAEDISWTPWSRLFFQVGLNYVLSETKTPASEVTQAILNSQNNYWTLNFSTGIVLDDKTDLNLSYFYYQADDYQDNSAVGVPFGAGGQEHGVSATLVRRLSKNLRLTLRYAYYNYDDALSGGHNNYAAHAIYTSLRYRF